MTAYDLIKYNLSVDPRHLKPGSLLVVPKQRSEPCKIAPVLSWGVKSVFNAQHTLIDVQDRNETELLDQQRCLKMPALAKVQAVQHQSYLTILHHNVMLVSLSNAGIFLALLLMLVGALQLALIAVIFAQHDAKWTEAITAGLGIICNSMAIYLGFHTTVKQFRAAKSAQQNSNDPLPQQYGCTTFLLVFVAVPNRALDEHEPWWWFEQGHAMVQASWWLLVIDVLVVSLRASNGISTTMFAVFILVTIYGVLAAFFLFVTIVFMWWAPDLQPDHQQQHAITANV